MRLAKMTAEQIKKCIKDATCHNSTRKAIGMLPRKMRDAVREFVAMMSYARSRTDIEFDVTEALYWISANYHSGQGSDLCSVGSVVEFKPSPLADGPEESACELYDALAQLEETGV